MSSSHCKPGKNQSFFRVVAEAYSEFSEVVWSEPKINWNRSDLEEFDQIVFGFSPPTSMGANHLYAALKVLNLMYESPKLRIVIDSPQMWQYKNSVRAFKRDPDQIFGSFYVNRKNYNEAKNGKIRNHSESLAEKFSSIEWPKTLIPALPWAEREDLYSPLSFMSESSIIPLNLDALLLRKETPRIGRLDQWAADNTSSTWTQTTSKSLRFPVISVKNSTKPKDTEAEQRILTSMGLLISPQDRKTGTWWSYRYIQGLNTTTPIATYWQDSAKLGEEWSLLAYQLEDMQPYERQHMSFQQIKSYEAAIPNRATAISKIKNLVIDFQPRGM